MANTKSNDTAALVTKKLNDMRIPNKMSKKEVKLFASLGSNAQMVITPSSATSGDLLHQVKTEKGIRNIAKAHYDSIEEFKKLTLSASRKQKLQASRKAMKLNCAEGEAEEEEAPAAEPVEAEEPIEDDFATDGEDNGDNPAEEEAENELYNSISAFTEDVQVVGAVIFNAPDPETGDPVCYVAFKDSEEETYVCSMVMSDSSFDTADSLASAFLGGEDAPSEGEEGVDDFEVEGGDDFDESDGGDW